MEWHSHPVNYLVAKTLLYEAQQQLVCFLCLPGLGAIKNSQEVFGVLGIQLTRSRGLGKGGVEVIAVVAGFLLPVKNKFA